jgi:putative membrane protein
MTAPALTRQQSRPAEESAEGLRRTSLASERTYLAWLRTGLAAFAVSLGVGKIAPVLTGGAKWPYAILGAAFALLGVAFVAYGVLRQKLVGDALARGEYVEPDQRVLIGLAAAMILLGIAMCVFVVFH